MARIKLNIQSVLRQILHEVKVKGSILSTVCKRVMQYQKISNYNSLKLRTPVMFMFSFMHDAEKQSNLF